MEVLHPSNARQGSFVLVIVKGEKINLSYYKYACVIQATLPSGEYEVMSLKSFPGSKTIFKAVEHDVFTICDNDIIGVLPVAKMEPRLKYCFTGPKMFC